MNTNIQLNLIVLYSLDIEKLSSFYQSLLGIKFVKEKHGAGVEHYACQLNELVLEFYPSKKEADHIQIGFKVHNLDDIIRKLDDDKIYQSPKQTAFGYGAIVYDPDKRLVHLLQY